MIIGTAGHIDHGKTSLVRRLTGVDTDRLKEEKARGISIDLGFAYWPQPDGSVIGFIDVPGHEALVHNMLAGATGIDVVLFVVAADDGVMPQTREHLAIMDLLGLDRGVVALNKADRVGPERIAAARAEIEAVLAGTGLAGSPVVPVSAVTGEGIEELGAALRAALSTARSRRGGALFRLAVDRVFTLKGQGTAVTGTVLSGSVRVDDTVTISPSGLAARVRSIHAQNQPASEGHVGQRCALVLSGAGIEKDKIGRGDVVLAPELHAPTSRIDVSVRILATEPRPVGTWFPIKFHAGASEVSARLVPLDPDKLAPGATGMAQIVLDRPLALAVGDRFVVRDTSSSRTVGGGAILDLRPPERRRRTPERLAILEAMAAGEPLAVARALSEARGSWLDLDGFLRDRALLAVVGNDLATTLDLVVVGAAGRRLAFGRAQWSSLRSAIIGTLDATHADRPDLPGIARERLRVGLPMRLPVSVFNQVLDRLVGDGDVALDRSWVRRPSHQVRFSEQEEALWRRIWPRLVQEPYKPPRVRDISKSMEIDEALVRRLSKMAARRGDVEEVAHDHFFARVVVERMADIAKRLAAEAPGGAFSAADFRDQLDNGRKVAIQILEFFDRHGLTIRRKDMRRINVHRADLFAPQTSSGEPAAEHGGVPLPVGRPDFKSGWGRQTASGGFDSHPPPPHSSTNPKGVPS